MCIYTCLPDGVSLDDENCHLKKTGCGGWESFSSLRRARCIIIKRGDGDCHNGQLLSAESARTEGQLAVSAGDLMPCLLAGR